jgi:3-dehydroquinate dehydratase-1
MRNDICLSIGNIDYSETIKQLKKVAMAEIRMDLLKFTDEQFALVFNSHPNLIATYRISGENNEEMVRKINLALENGCKYVDIDISTPIEFIELIKKKTAELNRQLILSYHNFEKTPNTLELEKMVESMFQWGAYLAKIACMANTEDDCDRVLSLYSKYKNLIAFSMGKIGKRTRISALNLGAPFTYASIEGKETAPGQMNYDEMEALLKLKNHI